jgi:predicted DNA-binding transcriptional regulator YafY
MTVRGGCTLEITPWFRGWGPDVEVLEPEELRDRFRGWGEELNEIYNERKDIS